MPSGLRVVGIGEAPREGFDIEAKERMVRERRTDDFIFRGGGGKGWERREGEGHTSVPLTLDVFVNVNTSSADRHVNVTVDHARMGEEREAEKKGERGNAKKFAWGLMPI